MTKVITLVAAATMAISAQAQERKLKPILTFASFNEQTSPDKIDDKTVYYTEKVQSFGDWQKDSPNEVEFLNLYQGYKEPTVKVIKNGLESTQVEKITVFATRAKMILNRPASQIDLKVLLQPEVFKKLTPNMEHQLISPNAIMPLVVGKGEVNNFAFCNKDGLMIARPKREKDLTHALPKDRSWCDNADRSVCIQSCYKFGPLHQLLVTGANLTRDEERKIDMGVAIESEMRYFVSEAEMGRSVPLSSLTGLNTPVRGVLEQSMFYWNQIMQFGKVLAVFQEDPNNAQRTIVTSLFVIGIKSRTYNGDPNIAGLLKGKLRKAGINEATGVMAGIPVFTQEMAREIGKIFEK